MKFYQYNTDQYPNLLKKHTHLTGDTTFKGHVLVAEDENKVIGYLVYFVKSDVIKLDWIYAIGRGKDVYAKFEKLMKSDGKTKIILNCSIDPHEKQISVMKRINFWINRGFHVVGIKYRETHGPLFRMSKIIN